MLVNDLVLAKIAAQMGYQPFVIEEGMGLSKARWVTDNTVLHNFIADHQVKYEEAVADAYIVPETFVRENRRIINRARKKETSIIIAENSCFGRGYLTPEIIHRIDVLELLISSSEMVAFKAFISLNEPYNRTFEEAKSLITQWMAEKPVDYMGLLKDRLFTKSYEQYFQNGITGDASIQDALQKENQNYTLYETNEDFGGTAIRIAEKAPTDLDVTFILDLSKNHHSINARVAAWQLTLAGFKESEKNHFEFNPKQKMK